jgi:hypothetical protein
VCVYVCVHTCVCDKVEESVSYWPYVLIFIVLTPKFKLRQEISPFPHKHIDHNLPEGKFNWW